MSKLLPPNTTAPPLDQTAVTDYFDAGVAQRPWLPDAATVGGWGKLAKYRMAAQAMQQPEVGRVLDLGCNIGHLEHLLAQTDGPRPQVVGVDLSAPALRRARSAQFPFASYALASAVTLPFAAQSFDLIVSLDVLEHVPDQPAFLRECRRVLRPHGRLLLTTPNPTCLGSIWGYRLGRGLQALRGRPEAEKDLFVGRAALARLLEEAAFPLTPQAIGYFLPRPFVLLKGRVLTPPLPARLGLRWQQLWSRRWGLDGRRLSPFWRERLYHTLVADVRR